MASTQKVCPKCKDQTDGRPTPHTVKDGKWKCGLCGHKTSKKTYNTKKSKMLGDMINKFNEAKDSREYGYEGEMAMSQLKGIIMHAKQLHDMLEPDTDLPEWVQSKITLSYDYIQTAADYMSTELDEEAKVGRAYKVPVKSPQPWTDGKVYKEKPVDSKKLDVVGKKIGAIRRKKGLSEDAPANAVGGGKIAGMGVGSQGEPGVSKKRNPILQPTGRRKSLTDFIRGN